MELNTIYYILNTTRKAMDWKIKPAKNGLRGELTVPPDKSVSHRAIMFGAISAGRCRVDNFLFSADCMSTLEAFRAMGTEIDIDGSAVVVKGKGLKGLLRPSEGKLYLGNSGTTMRIISGILAGQPFSTCLTGDESLSRRPMGRVTVPLREMGASISTANGDRPPISIEPAGGELKPIDYVMPIASAQVKSCILSAGLYADGVTSVTEPFQSRDHTERMLEYFSADIKKNGRTTRISGLKELEPKDIRIPGDISSAAFFIVAALIVPGSDLILKGVGLNPTRVGILNVLERMGGRIDVLNREDTVEPVGDIRIRSSELRGAVITEEEIPLLIDEVPILVVASLMAEGVTEIRGVSELKVKETDRIKSMEDDLLRLGREISENEGVLKIEGGPGNFRSASLDSFGDHRIAMSMAVAALAADKECIINDVGCADTSYPGFIADLERVVGA